MTRRLKALAAGVALILTTNAVALAGVLYNRSGAPDSRLTLSQRELAPPYAWGFEAENSGLSLRLVWRTLNRRTEPEDDVDPFYFSGRHAEWLDAGKLAALGFDTSVPPQADAAAAHYARQLPRDARVVLELDGPAYAAALRRAHQRLARAQAEALAAPAGDPKGVEKMRAAEESLAREQTTSSRLFVVDAGVSQAELRAKYTDTERYAIVPAHVSAAICDDRPPSRLCGRIEDLDVADINVPLSLRPNFVGAEPHYGVDEDSVRYEAVVAFGRRLEPWLLSATRR